MDEATRNLRRARQMLMVDRLLGADAVPLGRVRPAQAVGSAAPPPAPPSPPTAALRGGREPGPHFASRPATAPRPESASPASPSPSPPPPGGPAPEKTRALRQLEAEVTAWVEAEWPRDGWTRVVFGEGDPNASLMFIGEAPGADEDEQGRPFVGRAGQLLNKQIAAMGLEREQVYIANIGKARPPGNRAPSPDEAALWLPWLERQIDIIHPRVIVSLGATSAKYLLKDPKLAITRVRGQWRTYRGIDLMPTFHPAYLLRQYTRDYRQRVWSDLQAVMQRLGLEPK